MLTSGMGMDSAAREQLAPLAALIGRLSCHATQARSLSPASTADFAGRQPRSKALRSLPANASGRKGKQVASKSHAAIISGIPPALLATNGTAAPRHSSTVFGRLSTSEGIPSRRVTPVKEIRPGADRSVRERRAEALEVIDFQVIHAGDVFRVAQLVPERRAVRVHAEQRVRERQALMPGQQREVAGSLPLGE